MKKIMIYGLLAMMLSLSACESWISVKPSDRLSEDIMFSSREGFLKALNGVYVDMAGETLYGRNLSAGAIDVMASYYTFTGSTHAYYYFSNYTYTNADVANIFNNIWLRAYVRISDINIILEHCGNGNQHLNDTYFGIVKGEALALRAMLHLDLFRIFGEIYSIDKTAKKMPYMTKADQVVQPLLSGEEICSLIIQDLTDALELLKNVDPVRTEGTLNSPSNTGNDDLRYRQFRLNYYAVQGLLMRAYLVSEQQPKALQVAREIITEVEANNTFPFVTSADATNSTTPDRVFSTEVMYALYKSNRGITFDDLFSYALAVGYRLTFSTGRLNEVYPDQNDYRYRFSWATNASDGVLYCNKYADLSGTGTIAARSRFMVSLMRMTEVYLMAAQCTSDLSEGIGYLNKVRLARNTQSVNPASTVELSSMVDAEFKRETLGEGQLFYYYKRLAKQNIPDGSQATGVKNMSLTNYVVPMPDVESSQRIE